MISPIRPTSVRFRLLSALASAWRRRGVSLKAISFALIGIVNSIVDYGVFLLARAALSRSAGASALFIGLSASCRCAAPATIALIAANMVSWLVAVSGSYILNSSITFAAESGRRLRWRSYFAFAGSGVLGWLANTATLVVAAQMLLLPVWLAKALAVLASFLVNFSLSHFVVFRVRDRATVNAGKDA